MMTSAKNWFYPAVYLVFVAVSLPVNGLLAQTPFATNWPNFRGPTFNGTSDTATPPTEWAENQNLKWKIELPGAGNNSSPIVWGDQVIVLDAIPSPPTGQAGSEAEDTAKARGKNRGGRRGRGGRGRNRVPQTPTKFVTICFDRNSGEKIWEQIATESTPHQGTHPDHSFASASPVTDGKHIYSHFGSRGLYCYDMDGSLQWKRDDFGQMTTRNGFGEGSSPCLYQDVLIVPWDHEGQSWVMAIDALTGKTKWKQERDEPSNWVTPVVLKRDGKEIVVTGGENFARGYDLATGKEIWRSSGFTSRPISSPVVHQDLVLLASSRQGFYLSALNVNGQGNLNDNGGIKWSTDTAAPDVPSMMASAGRVYHMKGSTNILYCLDANTGDEIFSKRLPGIRGVYASIVAADGKVIIVGRDGNAVVLQDSDRFQVLAENQLDDAIDATPALAGKQMFLRGKKYLYCLENGS
ncbi:MAG: PQQ-binding-like beta-propeller repeat protein [Planctomycetaceae bacterium]|nr:PQQ-binding-like beta-propeller repeat protein [Planctomycetaceae bacterium]MCP4464350.1 PQQ-binding-like beta-propeller repeat protein [Planctomycetaceae bacterium]